MWRGWLLIALLAILVPGLLAATAGVLPVEATCTLPLSTVDNVYANVSVVAAGSSLAFRVYTLATLAYSLSTGAGTVAYGGTGSGAGKSSLITNQVDWAGTDSVFDEAAYSATPDLQLLPAFAVAVAPVHNVEGVPPGTVVVMAKSVLARVFLGEITLWNDAAITASNPGITLPAAAISVVVRGDKSGSTDIFTQALALFDSSFNTTIGASSLPVWQYAGRPNAVLAAQGTSGVVGVLLSTANSIAYVSSDTAKELQLSMVGLATAGGGFITADLAGIQASQNAVGGAFSPRFTASLVSTHRPDAFPIASYTYIAVRRATDRAGCTVRSAALEFLAWFYSSAIVDSIVTDSGFSPLLPTTRKRARHVIGQEMQCQGAVLHPDASSTLIGRGTVGSVATMRLADSIWAAEQQPRLALAFDVNSTLPPDAVFALYPLGLGGGRFASVPDSWLDVHIGTQTASLATSLAGLPPQGLSLSLPVLTQVLLGEVVFYDDASIAALNPGVGLPHTEIVWVAPAGRADSDCSAIIAAAVSDESTAFATVYGDGSWPAGQLGSRFHAAATAEQTPFVGAATTGGLWCTTGDSTGGVGHAVSVSGVAQASTADDVCARADDAAAYSPRFSACVAFHVRRAFVGTTDCTLGRNVVGLGKWMLTGGAAVLAATGFEVLGNASTVASLQLLAEATCDGVSMLSPPQPCTPADLVLVATECSAFGSLTVRFEFPAAAACLTAGLTVPPATETACDFVPLTSLFAIVMYGFIAMVLAFLAWVAWWVRCHGAHKVIKFSQPLFCYLFLVGGASLSLSTLTFLGSVGEVTCRARVIAFNLAFSAMFEPLHLKLYRVYRIFDNPTMSRIVIRNHQLLGRVAVLLLAEGAFIAVWCLASEFVQPEYVALQPGAPVLQLSACSSSRVEFPTAMLVWKAVQLGTGMFFAVKTWHVSSLYSEARPLAIAIGNIAFVGSLTAGFSLLLPLAASWRSALQVFGTCWGVVTTVAAVFAPKMLQLRAGADTATGAATTTHVRNPLGRTTLPSRTGSGAAKAARTSAVTRVGRTLTAGSGRRVEMREVGDASAASAQSLSTTRLVDADATRG